MSDSSTDTRTDSADPVLSLRGVTVRFPGVTALADVDFDLRAGEIHGLVGENGAGKSSLIKILTGVYQATEGEVHYLGEQVSFATPGDAQDAGIATIYQEVDLVPLMTVAQNLFIGRAPRTRWHTIDFTAMNERAKDVLADFGIPVDPTTPLQRLGLGVQQMVAIARSVSQDARAVIMDEPTSSLEAAEVDTLFEVIRRLHDRDVAILFVSHRLDELFRICDQVTVLRDGHLVHSGPLDELDRGGLVAKMLGRELVGKQTQQRDHDPDDHDDRPPMLEVSGLTRMPTLDHVDLQVRPGEVLGLAGLLGAGRSETARAIMGIDTIDEGTVTIDGQPLRTGRPRRAVAAGVALLPEDRRSEGIIPDLSIRENIALAALPQLSKAGVVSESAVDDLVDSFMQRLDVKASGPDQKVRELSGGNQQKVMLARWLCVEPRVMIMDEPTRGIDVGAKVEIRELIDELAEQGLAIVLISSELDEVVEESDRVVVLRDGEVAGRLEGERVTEDELMQVLASGGDEQ